MVAISENFADILEPGLRKVYSDQFQAPEEMRPLLFNVQPATTSYVKDSSVGAFGDMEVFKGTIPYDEVVQGYDVTYTDVQLAKGFKVERKLLDDDLYGIILRKPQGLALAAHRTFEKHGASVFNNSFSGSGTIVVDGITVLSHSEGLSLCNTGHTNNRTSTTQSNSGTSARSATAVEATRKLMRKFKDDTDNFIVSSADLILTGIDGEEDFWEIIATKGKVDSAENNANFHFGKYKLAVWDYITSSKDWWMIDSTMMKMFLNWFDRIPLEFFQDRSSETLIAKFANYARVSFGFSSWEWIYGHDVA